jgi:hypothetical protein
MPEPSPDATIDIVTSWQALEQAETADERTIISHCTVLIVFAAIYIEANLNHIIEKMGSVYEMMEYYGYGIGLRDKLTWFYGKFCAEQYWKSRHEVYEELIARFPGFDEIYSFRNSVSHGVIDRSLANLEDAKKMRFQAKAIVDDLFDIANQAGFEIPRGIDYEAAIACEDNTPSQKKTVNDAG